MDKRIRKAAAAHEPRLSLGELIHQHVRLAIETAVHEELRVALGTSPYERSDIRRGYRNGTKARTLTGPTGPAALMLPRATLFGAAGGKEWKSAILPRYQRRMPEVNQAVVATYLAGGNTRRIRGALQPLLKAAPLSKSAVSRVVATLKDGLEAWRTRSLADLDVIYVYLDGFALRVRSAGKVVSVPVLGVIGVLPDGHKHLLALDLCAGESFAAWKGCLALGAWEGRRCEPRIRLSGSTRNFDDVSRRRARCRARMRRWSSSSDQVAQDRRVAEDRHGAEPAYSGGGGLMIIRAALAAALALGLLTVPLVGETQPAKTMYRIGVLSPGASPPGLLEAFREGLRDLGYVDGQTAIIEWRFAEGKNDRLPALADELVRLKVDVIFAVNTPAARAAKNATTTIPIVIARLADPVKTGLVSSIARPGGNITGLSSIAEDVAAKRLELLKEVLPGVSRIALLFNAENPGHLTVVGETVRASTQLGLQLQTFGLRGASDVPKAFRAATGGRAEALFLMDDVRITLLKGPILEQATKLSWPVFAQYRELVEAGALLAFAHSATDEYRQAAYYVDRILKGAKPGDLPIQQPKKFDLIINLKAARTLGLMVPPSVLLRANEIIE